MLDRLRPLPTSRHLWPLIGLLPMIVFAVGMLVMFAHRQGRETESEMRRHLEILSRQVERRLGGQFTLLTTIAALPWIDERNFEPLKAHLERLRPTFPAWRNIIVSDLERQIFNLNLHPGVAGVVDPATIETVVRTRAGVIGGLRDGILSIRVPVERSGRITKTVVAALDVSVIAQVFSVPDLPAGWGAVVFDAHQDVIATTGAISETRARLLAGAAAIGSDVDREVRRVDPEGDDLIVVTGGIARTGWRVAVLAPNRIVFAGGVRIDHLLYGAAVLAAIASLALLWRLSRSMHLRTEELQGLLRRLETSEVRFRDGIESMSEGFLLFDAEDRLVAWNRRVAELLPQSAGALKVGARGVDFVAGALESSLPQMPAEEMNRIIAARLEARERHERFAYTTADGRRLEIEDRRSSAGGIVSILHDATDAHLWASRLAASEVRFRDFAETASDWFWETGPDHRYTFLASRSGTLHAAQSLIGKTRIEVAREAGGSAPEALMELERRMDRHESFHDFEYTRRHIVSGQPTIFEVSGKPIIGANGEFLGYRGTGRDASARKRQEVELARALAAEQEVNAAQRRFIAIVSHEFRTPLTIIDGASQRIRAQLESAPPDVVKRLERIRAAVARMTELIDRTLSSARLDTGGIELNPSAFDLVELLSDVCDRQRQATPEFEIRLDCRERAQILVADPRLIDQVLSNLMSNAVKYSGRARRVDVGVAGDDSMLEVAVTDYGIGIPENEIPKLFTRFFRASTASGLPGTGIGLNMCRDLVHLHGGSIAVESTVGQGSTFRVRIPRGRPETEIHAA